MNPSKVILIGSIGRDVGEADYFGHFARVLRDRLPKTEQFTTITNCMPTGTVTEADTESDSTGADGAPAASASDDDDGGESDGEPARPRSRSNARRVAAPLPARPVRSATASAGTTPPQLPVSGPSLWKIDTVLQQYPVSRSAWYQGIKDGQYPKPVRIGARAVAWRSTEVLALIESLQTA